MTPLAMSGAVLPPEPTAPGGVPAHQPVPEVPSHEHPLPGPQEVPAQTPPEIPVQAPQGPGPGGKGQV